MVDIWAVFLGNIAAFPFNYYVTDKNLMRKYIETVGKGQKEKTPIASKIKFVLWDVIKRTLFYTLIPDNNLTDNSNLARRCGSLGHTHPISPPVSVLNNYTFSSLPSSPVDTAHP